MQLDFFQVFQSSQSKPITTALKLIKKIVKDDRFDHKAFLEHSTQLLSSGTKTIVRGTLMVLDQIAKSKTALRTDICRKACNTFIHQDEAMQLRAAKLIVRYGDKNDEDITTELAMYANGLLYNAKALLADFVESKEEVDDNDVSATLQVTSKLADSNRIPEIKSYDDLVFLASQALDGNEPWHFDWLPASLLKFQPEMTTEQVEKLEPAFQRVYKMLYNGGNARMGLLDNMMAHFLYEYVHILMKRFPKASSLYKLKTDQIKKEKSQKEIVD